MISDRRINEIAREERHDREGRQLKLQQSLREAGVKLSPPSKAKPLSERVKDANEALYGRKDDSVKARAAEAAKAIYGERGAAKRGFK